MFSKLKQRLKESVERFSKEKITTRRISEKDIDEFFDENEIELLQMDIAVEVVDFLRKEMKEKLVNKSVKRGKIREEIEKALKGSLMEIVKVNGTDIEEIIDKNKAEGKPACFVFLGFNGSGKTTTIARIAKYLIDRGYKPVMAAADTFRAAAIEQIEIHAKNLGIKLIKHQYGADPAAVVFDAVKYAQSKKHDAVLVDTAGRTHIDKNLMDELEKIIRVNQPDLRILVIDSLTGNDAVEQARKFNEGVGVDAVIMTKVDVNEKGGSIFSVCYAINKPVIFLGTGQGYGDIEKFNPERFVENLFK